MQRSIIRTDTEKYVVLAVAGLLALLVLVAALQAAGTSRVVETRSTGSAVALAIDKKQADDIASAHTRGRVTDTDVIRDNGVLSYLVTVDPDQDNGDASARRLLFIDPMTKN